MKTRRQTRDFGQDLSNIVPDRPRDKKKVPPSSENTLQQSMVLPPRETDFRKKTAPINKREASWNAVDDYQEEILNFTFGFDPTSIGFNLKKNHSLQDLPTNNPDQEFVENLPVLNLKKCNSDNMHSSEQIIKSPELFQPFHKIFPFYSPDLTNGNRKLVISWLVQVHKKMKMRYETLYLTIFLMDQYCKKAHASKKNYQLLASTCLFIAGKYQEISTPKITKIISLCDGLFTSKDVLRMQSQVFMEMNFLISQPSPNWFMGSFLNMIKRNVIQEHTQKIPTFFQFQKCCYSLLELSLFHIEIQAKYSPQIVAAAVIYTISIMHQFLNVQIDTVTSKFFSNFDRSAIRQCNKLLGQVMENRMSDISYEAVREKYVHCFLFCEKY